MEPIKGTTILCVRRGQSVVIGGDGQVTQGDTIMKGDARKVRRLHHNQVIAGFAGGTADAFTLFERNKQRLSRRVGGAQSLKVRLPIVSLVRGEVKKIFPAEYARVVAVREFDANRVVPLGDDIFEGNQFLACL